jgi:hypothetical protein
MDEPYPVCTYPTTGYESISAEANMLAAYADKVRNGTNTIADNSRVKASLRMCNIWLLRCGALRLEPAALTGS